MRGGNLPRLLAAALVAAAWASAGQAAEVKVFRAQSAAAFGSGTFDGVGLDPLGSLLLAGRAERVAALPEPFLLSACRQRDGWVVGTGNAGRVLRVGRDGVVATLFETAEPEVLAVLCEPDGTVYAGSSPRGKVYRQAPGGKAEVWFDPHEEYIWALERATSSAGGPVLVATGTQGRLYRVTGRDSGDLLYDAEDTHLRAMRVLPDGRVLLGTAGEGLILLFDPSGPSGPSGPSAPSDPKRADGAQGPRGQARTLYDATQPEIVGFALAPDGTAYAAALDSEAGLAVPPPEPSKEAQAAAQAAAASAAAQPPPAPVVSVEAGEPPRASGKGPRSEALRIAPDGAVESIWSFPEDTVYSLLWHQDRLWVGTGLEGRVFSWIDSRMVLQGDLDERQVMALLPDEPGPAFATTNGAAIYRTAGTAGASGRAGERHGTYTSAALDAGQIARFGAFRWRGETAAADRIQFSFRSGLSSEPDRTWTEWTPARSGREIALGQVPPGRYLQWRAELSASGAGNPRITNAEISYRQTNLRPRISRFGALEPGEILVPTNFNPANQAYEPAHPNRDGIFTSLEPAAMLPDEVRLKTIWKKGSRTLRWEANDPNGDQLRYALWFRQETQSEWLPMSEDLKDSFWSFDEHSLPDGVYRFRLQASDREANLGEPALEAEQVSEPVVVDSSPAALRALRRDGGAVRVEIEDRLNPLLEAVVSVDGGKWEPALPADGLLDSRAEVFSVAAPAGTKLLLLRVTDAAFNLLTFDLLRDGP